MGGVGLPFTNQQNENQECIVREQDRFMPIANVIRIMRKILPPHAKISDEAKETIQECVSEYISFVTGEANERCQREQRKTVTAEDVLWAMSKLGFDDYIEPLTLYLHRYREFDTSTNAGSGGGGGGGSHSGQQLHHHHSLCFKRSAPPTSVDPPPPPAHGRQPSAFHHLPHHHNLAAASSYGYQQPATIGFEGGSNSNSHQRHHLRRANSNGGPSTSTSTSNGSSHHHFGTTPMD